MLGLLQRHQAWCEHSVKWLLAQFRVAICFNEVKARLRQTELNWEATFRLIAPVKIIVIEE